MGSVGEVKVVPYASVKLPADEQIPIAAQHDRIQPKSGCEQASRAEALSNLPLAAVSVHTTNDRMRLACITTLRFLPSQKIRH